MRISSRDTSGTQVDDDACDRQPRSAPAAAAARSRYWTRSRRRHGSRYFARSDIRLLLCVMAGLGELTYQQPQLSGKGRLFPKE